MISALLFGTIGLVTAYFIGHTYLGLEAGALLHAFAASSIAGFVSLLVVLNAQLLPAIKKTLLPSITMTWVCFIGIYVVITVLLSPRHFSARDFVLLMPSLIFSTGFIIIIFGPIQDRIVRWRQRTGRM